MSISTDQLAPLRSFGYTEVESRFLYLVATHSGYFTVWQFLDFAHAKSGKRNAHLIEKLFSQGHATAQRYRRRSCVYHLHSRALYDAIGKGELTPHSLRMSRTGSPRSSTSNLHTPANHLAADFPHLTISAAEPRCSRGVVPRGQVRDAMDSILMIERKSDEKRKRNPQGMHLWR